MDRDNLWIALLKAWIRTLRGQSMDCTALGRSMDCAITHLSSVCAKEEGSKVISREKGNEIVACLSVGEDKGDQVLGEFLWILLIRLPMCSC